MEHVRWVAAQLHDMLVNLRIARCESAITFLEARFELVGLHLELIEGFGAALAVEGVIVHKVLDTANHYRVLQLTLTHSLEKQLNEAGKREALLHFLSGMYDTLPKRVEHQSEEGQLDDCDEDEPMEEHQQAQDHLEHLWVEVLLSLHRLICESGITLA